MFFHNYYICWAPVIAWHRVWCAFFLTSFSMCCQPSGAVRLQLVSAVELSTTEERFRRKKEEVTRGKVRAVRRVVKLVPAKVRYEVSCHDRSPCEDDFVENESQL